MSHIILFNCAVLPSTQTEILPMPCSDSMPTYPTVECFMQWHRMWVCPSLVWFSVHPSPWRGLTLGPFSFLSRAFSLRTRRSSSTMPFWHFCPRKLNCLHLTLSWRVISRLFDGWWPQRPASRLLLSYPSKKAAVICIHLALIFSRVSCWLTGMLCHSKVWSRVWRHRCNVNMNPYISVSPLACFSSFNCELSPRFILNCLSIVHLPSVFISGFSKCTSDSRAVCLNLFWPSSPFYFCASLPLLL